MTNHEILAAFLDTVDRDDGLAAILTVHGYCINDIPKKTFDEAMAIVIRARDMRINEAKVNKGI